MNTTRVLYMPIPMQLAGMPFLGKDGQPILDPGSTYGKGFVPPGYGSRDFGNTFNFGGQDYGAKDLTADINPGINLRQTNPLGWQEINKDNIGAAFQGLLNTVTANPAQYTPGYELKTSGHRIGLKDGTETVQQGTADQLLGLFNKGGPSIGFKDDTGSVQLTPGGLNLRSNKGWSAGFNPMGGNINVGPVGIQGTWADDKSIQATFNFGTPKESRISNPIMMTQFLEETNPVALPQRTFMAYDLNKYQRNKETPLKEEQTAIPYGGYGLDQRLPLTLMGPPVDVPLSEGRKLMEQQTEEYIRRNPGYRYQ
jgi:hypothetical protein